MSMTTTDLSAQARDVSVPIHRILPGLLLASFVLIVLVVLPYWYVWGVFPVYDSLAILVPFAGLVLVHELVHALGWKIAGNLRWRDFKFGFSWRGLSPYCHAKVPMTARAYRFGAMLPGIVTGVVPVVIGTLLRDPALTFLGAVLIGGAIGDLYVLWIIRRVAPTERVMDHPSRAGCLVLRDDSAGVVQQSPAE